MNNKRVTKSVVIMTFNDFCAEFDHKIAANVHSKGFYLDYKPTRGGFCIRQIIANDGSYIFPLGSQYQTPRTFVAMLTFAINCHRYGDNVTKAQINSPVDVTR